MKYTKKMIMVPETEYLALLNLIKGNDPIRTEKAMLEAKMHQNLNDPKTNEDLKAKRHTQYLKQRRQLKEMIETKPQRVIIDSQYYAPNLAPYLGINKETKRSRHADFELGELPIGPYIPQVETEVDYYKDLMETMRKDSERSKLTEDESERDETQDYEEETEEEKEEEKDEEKPIPERPKRIRKKTRIYDPALEKFYEAGESLKTIKLTPEKKKKLSKYMKENKNDFSLTDDDKVLGQNKKPIKGSDYKKILDYFSGNLHSPPKGTRTLENKLKKDPKVQEILGTSEEQIGHGRKILVKVKTIKTPGLERERSFHFKPKLWEKI